MPEYTEQYLTNAGITLKAKAEAGATLTFTRGAIGDGVHPGGGTEAELVAMTALLNERLSLGIIALDHLGGGQAELKVIVSSAGLQTGLDAREIGVFAQDPDVGEILYSVAYAPQYPDRIPAEGGSTALEGSWEILTEIGNAPDVGAVFWVESRHDVEVWRHWVAAVDANGEDTFVLPWKYRPRKPNLAIYVDGQKYYRDIHWAPPTGEEQADESTTVVFTSALSGLTDGVEFLSIPVPAGAYGLDLIANHQQDFTLTNADNKWVHGTEGATGTITATLANISPGWRCKLVKTPPDLTMVIQAPAGVSIMDSVPGGTLTNSTQGQAHASVWLEMVSATQIILLGGNGKWSTNSA